MISTMQVDTLAEKIKTPTKATFLTSVFKNGLKKKLSHLNVGCISVVDGEDNLRKCMMDSLSQTPNDVARVVHHMYKHEFFCA